MSWPLSQDYNEAIQDPRTNLADPELLHTEWDLEPLVYGEGEAGVDRLLNDATDRASAFDERYAGKLPLFGGIDKARFRRQVSPGDTLEMEVVIDQLAAAAGKATGTARVGGQTACKASMLFVIVDG